MQDTIKGLWNGQIKPAGELVKEKKDISEALAQIEQLENELYGDIVFPLAEKFSDYLALAHQVQRRLLEEAFTEGFSTGMKITLEAFDKIK